MGKYAVTVSSTSQSLYEVDGESNRNLIAGVAFGHEHPHIPEILKTYYGGLALRIHQIYNYARDTYTYGLPNGYEEVIGDPSISTIEAALEAEVGYPVQVHYASIEEPDDYFFAQMYSQLNWGYRLSTRVLHKPPVSPLSGQQVSIYGTTWAGRNSRLDITLNRGIDRPYYGAEGDVVEHTVYVNASELNPVPDQSKLYYHVRYTPVGSTSSNHLFWAYEVGSGVYPDLDTVTYEDTGSPFLPIIPLREHNKNLGPKISGGKFVLDSEGSRIRPSTDLYTTSRQLCNKLDTDFDDLCLEISKNESIDDIDHAYLIFGVDIRTTHTAGRIYLYDFFEDLAVKRPGGKNIIVQDANFRADISFSSNTRTVHTGNLSKPVTISYSGETLTVRKNLRNGTYGQVVVTNLKHVNHIYRSHNVETTLSDSADSDAFLIPINIDVLSNTKGLMRREDLLKESFKLVFNSYDRRKLKWYESGFFKFVMLVIAVVAIVWSAGTAAAGINVAYAAGGIAAAITAGAKMILIAIAVGQGVKWLASQIPPEVAIVIAVVMTIAALSGAVSDTGVDFIDAESLLSMTSAFTDGIQEGIMDDLSELNADIYDFMESAEAAQTELDELIEALDVSESWFDQLVAEKTEPVIIETPTEFYTRTIHAGNIGVTSLSIIENYVEKSLELPELVKI